MYITPTASFLDTLFDKSNLPLLNALQGCMTSHLINKTEFSLLNVLQPLTFDPLAFVALEKMSWSYQIGIKGEIDMGCGNKAAVFHTTCQRSRIKHCVIVFYI